MKKILFGIVIIALGVLCIHGAFTTVFAQAQSGINQPVPQSLEGKVIGVIDEQLRQEENVKPWYYQKLLVKIFKSGIEDEVVTIDQGILPVSNAQRYAVGDAVLITSTVTPDGLTLYYISDYVRRTSLLKLFVLFVVITCIVGRVTGFTSIVGMGMSFFVLFIYVLPRILEGHDPVLTALMGSLIIVPITFYLSHGLNRKTSVAIVSSIISLACIAWLATVFVDLAHLTGYASEEASFLQSLQPGVMNMRGLLLAGILISALGVLDDITISQSAIVYQLMEANPKLSKSKVYRMAMNVGRDHIASMVNTLVLVYVGAALPLMLLFVNSPHPFTEVVNYEIIADEVVRTLVGSIGLIVAVPITTVLAANLYRKVNHTK